MTSTEFRAWRKSLGLNQTEAGALLGLTYRMISKYENGANIPRTTELACKWITHEQKGEQTS